MSKEYDLSIGLLQSSNFLDTNEFMEGIQKNVKKNVVIDLIEKGIVTPEKIELVYSSKFLMDTTKDELEDKLKKKYGNNVIISHTVSKEVKDKAKAKGKSEGIAIFYKVKLSDKKKNN